jgi:epithelial splicing regulatory protein 1/2
MAQTTTTTTLVCLFCVSAGKNGENLGTDEEQIVQIVYLLYDTGNNKVVTVQEFFVRPTLKDDVTETFLTDECKQTTGLTEKDVQNGQSLEQVLDELDRFLRTKEIHPQQGGKPFCFVTDGPLHLRMLLHPEAFHKNMTLAPYFFKYHDLRKQFKQFYKPDRSISNIDDMMSFLSLTADQSVEYGIRHCQNMAHIMQRLIIDGHSFTEPDEIMDRLEPGILSKCDVIDDDTVVKARGLPWQSSEQDITNFFKGLNVAKGGVALCLSQQGRRNGEALVRFEDTEQRSLALRRHKHHLGQRYIEVYKATARDFLSVAGGRLTGQSLTMSVSINRSINQ